jgi:hypothetical protein
MTDAASPAPRAVRVHRPTWLWAGALLAGSVVPSLLGGVAAGQLWAALARDILFFAAMLLFALGRDSVTARRPLGTIALIVFGAFQLAFDVLWLFVAPGGPEGSLGRVFFPVLVAWPYAYLAAGILATVQIARAGVLLGRWRWVPLAALCVAVGWQIVLMAALSLEPASVQLVVALTGLGNIVACVGAGVAAIVLSTVPREHVEAPAVPVFPAEG